MTIITAIADITAFTITIMTAVVTNHSMMRMTRGRLVILTTIIAVIIRLIIRWWPNSNWDRKYCKRVKSLK